MLDAAPPPYQQTTTTVTSSTSRSSRQRTAPRRENFASTKYAPYEKKPAVSSKPMMPPTSSRDVFPEKPAIDTKAIVDTKDLEKSMATQQIDKTESEEQDVQAEAALIQGCPSLLVPKNEDWSPLPRDLEAPAILPARTMNGRIRTMWNRSAGKPLKPLPASFDRMPPPRTRSKDPLAPTYSSFAPFYVPGKNKKLLAEGFEPRYPAKIMVDHNVSAVDWDRFLVNIRVAGALRGRETLIANLAPAPLFILHAGYGNYFITKAIMNKFKKRRIPEVLALIETYQHRFFQPRGLDVFIVTGTQRISGHFPGDMSYEQSPPITLGVPLNKVDSSSSSSSSSSSDSSLSSDDERMIGLSKSECKSYKKNYKKEQKKLRGIKKKEAIERRKQLKREREIMIAERRIAIGEEEAQGFRVKKHGKYRIVVQPQIGPAPQPDAQWIQSMEAQEKKWGKAAV